jgi:hypothetical protein
MANTLKLKRSAVQGKVPTTSDLELGELGLNTYDGKVYTKKDDGTASIVQLGGDADFLTTKRLIESDYTLESGRNMMSINDVTVDTGVTVEVAAGSTWVVVG